MEIEFNKLGFHVQKQSSMNSVSMYRNWVCWTRFPYIETDFIELGFHTWKPSSLNLVSGRSFNGWNFWSHSCYLWTLSVFTLRRLCWYIFLHIFWQLHLMVTANNSIYTYIFFILEACCVESYAFSD